MREFPARPRPPRIISWPRAFSCSRYGRAVASSHDLHVLSRYNRLSASSADGTSSVNVHALWGTRARGRLFRLRLPGGVAWPVSFAAA